MSWDQHKQRFDNCPTCKGLAIWLNHNQLTPSEANSLQAAECVQFIDNDEDCQRLNIKVSRKERRRAAMADAA